MARQLRRSPMSPGSSARRTCSQGRRQAEPRTPPRRSRHRGSRRALGASRESQKDMHICIYMSIDIYVYTHMYVHICMHIYIYTCIYVHIYICIYMYCCSFSSKALILKLPRNCEGLVDEVTPGVPIIATSASQGGRAKPKYKYCRGLKNDQVYGRGNDIALSERPFGDLSFALELPRYLYRGALEFMATSCQVSRHPTAASIQRQEAHTLPRLFICLFCFRQLVLHMRFFAWSSLVNFWLSFFSFLSFLAFSTSCMFFVSFFNMVFGPFIHPYRYLCVYVKVCRVSCFAKERSSQRE